MDDEFVPDNLKVTYKANLGELSRGNYQLTMQSGKLELTQKIVVQ